MRAGIPRERPRSPSSSLVPGRAEIASRHFHFADCLRHRSALPVQIVYKTPNGEIWARDLPLSPYGNQYAQVWPCSTRAQRPAALGGRGEPARGGTGAGHVTPAPEALVRPHPSDPALSCCVEPARRSRGPQRFRARRIRRHGLDQVPAVPGRAHARHRLHQHAVG